ncbi:MAG: glycoside hydrolase family 3 C-terminal domain-containing protein [Spirochaetales bacterium]|nr:glycoside hydrolase family 3 C-terminal domain-containing protein [Spirochaetales bacterium]
MCAKEFKAGLCFLMISAVLLLLAACEPYDPTEQGTDITLDRFPVLLAENATIAVDGDLGDWPRLIPVFLESDSQVVMGSRDQTQNYSGEVRLFFDKQNCYIAADIVDTTPFTNIHRQDAIWQGDSLEIYLGFHEEEHRSFDEDDFQLGISLVQNNQTVWDWPKGQEVTERELVVKKSEKGCLLEAKIPLTHFGDFSLHAGESLWIDFGINNAVNPQGDRTGQMIWYGNKDNYKQPNSWCRAVLVEDFSTVQHPVVTGSAIMDPDKSYKTHISYKGEKWMGSVTVNNQSWETDGWGSIIISTLDEENALLWLKVNETVYFKRIFGNQQQLREFYKTAAKQKTTLPPVPDDAPYKDPKLTIEQRVENLLSYMSLEEKIGQMTQIDKSYLIYPEDLAEYAIGSLLSGGGSAPASNNPKAWLAMYNAYQEAALKSRLGIPLIYGIDAVHGHNNVKGATIFPHHIGLGAARDPELVEKVARITAIEVSATGIDWTFGPCIAVPRDERWGRTYEGFSEDPELTALLGSAEVRGFQGADLKDSTTILAAAKHFAGDGGTEGGKDQGNVILNEAEFREIHLKPYVKAIAAGVDSIMISFSSWNGEKMHSNKYLITDVLKNEMNFDGLILSDWAAVYQLPGTIKDQIEAAVNAGIDMVMVPDKYMDFINNLTELVKENRVSLERIDDAVRRILTVKFKLGLFETPLMDDSLLDKVGSPEHREIAREAVRKSLVLLKNQDLLPLSKTVKHVHVAGALAKNVGAQCGGWTIEWQGGSGYITTGTTVYDAVLNTVSAETKVSFSGDAADPGDADVIIVVLGEVAYAEMKGDKDDLSLSSYSKTLIANAEKSGIPFVVILLSGRPLIITDEIELTDAFIAAWLPGTEAQGIADVLFGDYKPTGKLSYTWPRSNSQIPINKGDGKRNPLFPFGYGLSY